MKSGHRCVVVELDSRLLARSTTQPDLQRTGDPRDQPVLNRLAAIGSPSSRLVRLSEATAITLFLRASSNCRLLLGHCFTESRGFTRTLAISIDRGSRAENVYWWESMRLQWEPVARFQLCIILGLSPRPFIRSAWVTLKTFLVVT